jgi:hypothetical protein
VSVATPAQLAADPDNREHARQSRFRVDAELVRDNALAVSGLLASAIGGPSVKPYQPDRYWENLNFPPREYVADRGEEQYRRGLYVWWQRTFLHPSMLAFDAPSREECVAERNRSNLPQQALVLLNDPTYVEAARVLAARILAEGGTDTVRRLDFAWQCALQRRPRPEETATMTALLERHRPTYRADPQSANALHVGAVLNLHVYHTRMNVTSPGLDGAPFDELGRPGPTSRGSLCVERCTNSSPDPDHVYPGLRPMFSLPRPAARSSVASRRASARWRWRRC